MNFNDMLLREGCDPKTVIALRHRPQEPELRRVLPWLAAEKPEIFNAYQQTQGGVRVEDALESLKGRGHVASFIGREPGRALFVGLYAIASSTPLTRAAFRSKPENRELTAVGAKNWFTEEVERERKTVLWFDLVLTSFYSHWKGKLVVGWPGPERSWWRRAHRNVLPVVAVRQDSALDAEMPEWNALILSWEELKVLPARWRDRLSQWRGIYHIFDETDGKAYVGSAYGDANILGRWRNYAATGHGSNKLLRARKPDGFKFSILERVSPDMDARDVIRLESNWKDRLHTRAPHGLNEN